MYHYYRGPFGLLSISPLFPRTYTTTYPLSPTREGGFGNYLVTSGCTYGLNTVSFHSISFSVYFDAVSRWSLLMLVHQVIPCAMKIFFCLLTGICHYTSLGVVEGDGFEPPPRLAVLPALSTFPLSQPSFAVVPCAYPQGFIPSFIASQFDCDNQPPLPSH